MCLSTSSDSYLSLAESVNHYHIEPPCAVMLVAQVPQKLIDPIPTTGQEELEVHTETKEIASLFPHRGLTPFETRRQSVVHARQVNH